MKKINTLIMVTILVFALIVLLRGCNNKEIDCLTEGENCITGKCCKELECKSYCEYDETNKKTMCTNSQYCQEVE